MGVEVFPCLSVIEREVFLLGVLVSLKGKCSCSSLEKKTVKSRDRVSNSCRFRVIGG